MTIDKKQDGEHLTLNITGRLDTTTAPLLEEVLKESLNGITTLVFRFDGLEYISSAGLRILLSAQKIMNRQGNMIIRGANEDVREVFEMTGFSDILTLED